MTAQKEDLVQELEDVRDHNLRLKKALNSAIAGTLVTDEAGNITFVSEKWLEIFGYNDPKKILNTHIKIFFEEQLFNNSVIPLLKDVTESEKETTELEGKKKTEETFPLLAKVACVKKEGSEKIVGFSWAVKDLTKEKASEKKLNEKIEELEKNNKLMVNRELKMIELKKKLKECEENAH